MKTRLLICCLCAGFAQPVGAQEPGTVEFFEKKIRPVLADHCYECHSEAAAKANKLKGGLLLDSRQVMHRGGDSGPAVVPGKPADSFLVSAMKYDDFEMPPKGKLPDAVIDDFVKWVAAGAVDPRDKPSAVAKQGIDIAAGRQHWAYQQPRLPQLPVVSDAGWSRNAIDLFVWAKLDQHAWRPAKDARPEVLVRRLYYDLTGLPPTPEQIDQFVADPSDQAYDELVDQLLASPRFGERWGRHWLDVARFGESNTLRGTVFGQAWRYRDWVIDAFNRDLPFDQFVQAQVAGDLMPASGPRQRRAQLTATALLAMGNTNFENQDKGQLRMDVVDEQLETIGRAFLAQTIGCARCHDHKFDPIPARDYYALAGILRNTKTLEHANVSRWLEVPLPSLDPASEVAREEHEAAVAKLEGQIADLKGQLGSGPKSTGPKSIAAAELPGLVVDNGDAVLQGEWTKSSYSPRFVGVGYIHDGSTRDGQKSAEFEVQVPADGEYEVRVSYTSGTNRAGNTPVTVWFAGNQSKMTRINQRVPPPIDGMFISLGKFEFRTNEAARVRFTNAGTNGHVIVDAVQFLGGTASKAVAMAKPPQAKQNAKALQAELKKLEGTLKKLRAEAPEREMAMSVLEEEKIEDTHIHIRGNVHSLGAEVPRGFLQVANYDSPAEFTAEQSGRLELGQWLAGPGNPLTARVAVNRLWNWLFGAGLVRTVDNFGTVGEKPSHQELLDYLAIQFQRNGWSIKASVRQLVLSRTYRMSSAPAAPAVADRADASPANVDVENRLLWRMNRRRLEAECIRDTMLSVSGDLTSEMHGATYPSSQRADYGFRYEGGRRSVYVPVFRNSLPEVFEVFDFANPSMVVGRRSSSTVAPQALFMMNNTLVVKQSRQAARRLWEQMPAATDEERINRIWRSTIGRRPTDAERRVAVSFVSSADESSRNEVWGDLTQSLFATMDFRYLD